MRFLCDHCDTKIHTEHFWEGLSVVCPNCGQPTELKYRNGQSIPDTGYSISFRDFKQLITYDAYAEAIDPVIQKLLKCSIERTAKGAKLMAEDGSLIPFEAAHLEIQLDPEARGVIYNTAMSQWR